MGKTSHRTTLNIRGDANHTEGLATGHTDHNSGHVTVYTDAGSVTVSADTPQALRSLAKAFLDAADALDDLNNAEALAVAEPAA